MAVSRLGCCQVCERSCSPQVCGCGEQPNFAERTSGNEEENYGNK